MTPRTIVEQYVAALITGVRLALFADDEILVAVIAGCDLPRYVIAHFAPTAITIVITETPRMPTTPSTPVITQPRTIFIIGISVSTAIMRFS